MATHIGKCTICGNQIYAATNKPVILGHSQNCKNYGTKKLK